MQLSGSAKSAQQYLYQARTDEGALVRGSVSALSRDEAALQLSKQGLFVVQLFEQRSLGIARASPRATRSELAWQMWQLSVMVESGIALCEAVACLARQATRPRLRELLHRVEMHLKDGCLLSDCMSRYPQSFPLSLIAMIRASELTGSLSQVLHRASTYLIKDIQVVKRTRSAVAYPVFMVAICVAVVIFLLAFVLPKFAQVFESHGADLPAPTRLLMGLSDSVVASWELWGGLIAFLSLGALWWIRTPTGRRWLDWLTISLPVVGPILNMFHQTRTFRILALLLETKAPLVESIRIVRDIAPNSYYRDLWQAIEEQVIVGERLAAPLFAAPFIDASVAQMIDNGDRTGQLGKSFSRLADFLEERYEHTVKAALQLLEPMMILLLGGVVGFVALALMLPLFRAAGVISQH